MVDDQIGVLMLLFVKRNVCRSVNNHNKVGFPYSTRNQRRVPKLIPVLGSQPAGENVVAAITFCLACGYLPSCQASPPIGWYQIILLGDRGTCVNNLPRVAPGSMADGIRTRDLLIASPAP